MFGSTTAVGIDIGEKTVRAAMLQRKGKTLEVKSLLCEPYEADTLEVTLSYLKKQLRAAVKLPWHWPKHQVLGVPQSHVAIKRLPLDTSIPEHEQFVQIGLQLSESLGLPLNDLLYDYHALPDNNSAEVYACRKPLLEKTLKGLSSSGYQLSVIELQTHALMRLYRFCASVQRGSLATMLLDVGEERTQLCVGKGAQALFYRELPTPFGAMASEDPESQSTNTAALVELVQRQYQLAAPQLHGAGLSGVWLSGSAASLVDIKQFEKQISWPAYMLNPLNGLSLSSSLPMTASDSVAAWSTSIGLALRGMDSDG